MNCTYSKKMPVPLSIDCRVWENEETQTLIVVGDDRGLQQDPNLDGRSILVDVNRFLTSLCNETTLKLAANEYESEKLLGGL